LSQEGHFELVVGNAHHIKAVPGRKTDVKDAEWIADLVRHGLVRASFVPPPAIRELRDLVRLRRSLVEARTTERNRTLKLLETANIKLASVASDVFGISGMAMLEALVENKVAPTEMAELARGTLRHKREPLACALEGRMTEHHRYVLAFHLRRLTAIEQDLRALDARIEERAQPFQAQRQLLQQIPGVDALSAVTIIAEIGIDMSRFPTPGHLISWAGLCPRNDESAGKRQSTRCRPGNTYLKAALGIAALAASRSTDTFLAARYRRIRTRRGHLRALVAIERTMLTAIWHVLTTGQPYHDLGGDYFNHLDQDAIERRLVRRLEALGNTVTLS